MLRVSARQMQVLRNSLWMGFERRMLARIRADFPDCAARLADGMLLDALRRILMKAARYGIEREYDLQRFIEHAMVYGANLDERSDTRWIGDTLRRTDVDGTVKLDLLDGLATFPPNPSR